MTINKQQLNDESAALIKASAQAPQKPQRIGNQYRRNPLALKTILQIPRAPVASGKIFGACALLLVAMGVQCGGALAASTTQIMQQCNDAPALSTAQLKACIAAVGQLLSSYPAPGEAALLNSLGDRMDEIVGNGASQDDNASTQPSDNQDDNDSSDNNDGN